MADFQTYYGTDPWANIANNQRTFYDPTLRTIYRARTLYTDLVPYAVQPMAQGNRRMVFSSVFDYETTGVEPAPTLRYNEVAPGALDGRQTEITFERYQWQTAMDKSDELINYWNTPNGIMRIINERVGRNLVDTTNKLIRNAFLTTPYVNLPQASYTGADQIVNTGADKFSLDMVDEEILRAQTQNAWLPPAPGLSENTLLCIGTPGQHYDIVSGASNNAANKWIELQKYAGTVPFNSYELGSYHNSRHLFDNSNILWNCGKTIVSAALSSAHGELDGAADPASVRVDGVYAVGQAASQHYLQLGGSPDMSLYKVGSVVTIHKKKWQSADAAALPKLRVAGAPRFDEGTMVNRRIVAVDAGNKRIVLDRPLLVPFNTEINSAGTGAAQASSGVYGFVTVGVNLHINIMISAPNGIVCGVSVPPRFYAPMPIDTFQSVYRFGWDAFWKFQLIAPENYSVFVTSGSAKIADKKLA